MNKLQAEQADLFQLFIPLQLYLILKLLFIVLNVYFFPVRSLLTVAS